jgi:hypothetical protein
MTIRQSGSDRYKIIGDSKSASLNGVTINAELTATIAAPLFFFFRFPYFLLLLA